MNIATVEINACQTLIGTLLPVNSRHEYIAKFKYPDNRQRMYPAAGVDQSVLIAGCRPLPAGTRARLKHPSSPHSPVRSHGPLALVTTPPPPPPPSETLSVAGVHVPGRTSLLQMASELLDC